MSCRAWFASSPETVTVDTPVLAICVGHSRHNDMGAVACDGKTDEWTYNIQVAREMQAALAEAGVESVVVDQYVGQGYTAAMDNLSAELKELKVDAAIELHFNSAHPNARGSEMLHLDTSKNGEWLARCLQEAVLDEFQTADRGTKGRSAGRGVQFLEKTHCPAVIVEPFFGSNEADWEIFENQFDTLGSVLALGFIKYYYNK